MDLRKLSHAVYKCDYHIVLVTKYRRKVINQGVFAYFELKLREIQDHYPMLYIHEVNHDKDHIHFLASIPPTKAVDWFVGIIKANTARSLKQKFPFLKEVYWGTESFWSAGYYVSTVGINKTSIQKYIKHQAHEDAGRQARLV